MCFFSQQNVFFIFKLGYFGAEKSSYRQNIGSQSELPRKIPYTYDYLNDLNVTQVPLFEFVTVID